MLRPYPATPCPLERLWHTSGLRQSSSFESRFSFHKSHLQRVQKYQATPRDCFCQARRSAPPHLYSSIPATPQKLRSTPCKSAGTPQTIPPRVRSPLHQPAPSTPSTYRSPP